LYLSREIGASGRSVCRVNGKLVAAPVLRAIGELIVDLHGQHENHSLMKRDNHIELIDYFGGAELLAVKDEYQALYARRHDVKKRIADLHKNESERARAADILSYQINEIRTLKPQLNEDERLSEQITALTNAEKIINSIETAHAALAGESGSDDSRSALGGMSTAERALSQITQYAGVYADLLSRLSEARYMTEDVAASLRAMRDADNMDAGALERLNERYDAVERLKHKYGGSIPEVHKFYKKSVRKLSELSNSEHTAKELEAELPLIDGKMAALAQKLTGLRKNTASVIEEGVVGELVELEMKNCRFSVNIDSCDDIDDYNAKGRDQLEFLFCANPGEELKPLVRIASGGEMSRVMLAIKSVLAGADSIPTMIFDEIDNGISGKAAARVAEKLCLLSRGRQIICVTHLAQIASMADTQYLIEKTASDTDTRTDVYKLEDGARAAEISRILGGGAPTDASLRLSDELLARARQYKSSQTAAAPAK
jgi:DNA repair protein RecN (Recombination protein N)